MAATIWNASTNHNFTLSGGNLTATIASFSQSGLWATNGKSTGKWYFEITGNSISGSAFSFNAGIVNSSWIFGAGGVGNETSGNSAGIYPNSTTLMYVKASGTVAIPALIGTAGTVFGFAIDFDAKLMWLTDDNGAHWNGVTSGQVPGVSGGVDISILNPGPYFPAVAGYNNSPAESYTLNAGNSVFAFTVPTGFTGWDLSPTPVIYDTFDNDALVIANVTLTNSNHTAQGGSGGSLASGDQAQSIEGKKSGKWYVEFTCVAVSGNVDGVGIVSSWGVGGGFIGDTISGSANPAKGWGFYTNSNVVRGGSGQTAVNNATYGAGDVIGVAIDLDNQSIWWRKNGGSWIGTSGTPSPVTNTGGFSLTTDLSLNARVYPAVQLSGSSAKFTGNFGATAFSYPTPLGFTAGWTNTTAGTYFGSYATNGRGASGGVQAPPQNNTAVSAYVSNFTGQLKKVLFCYDRSGNLFDVIAAVYDSTGVGGLPGARLGISTNSYTTATGNCEVEFDFNTVNLVSGTTYWFGILSDSNAGGSGAGNATPAPAFTNGIAFLPATYPTPNNPFGASPSLASFRYPMLAFPVVTIPGTTGPSPKRQAQFIPEGQNWSYVRKRFARSLTAFPAPSVAKFAYSNRNKYYFTKPSIPEQLKIPKAKRLTLSNTPPIKNSVFFTGVVREVLVSSLGVVAMDLMVREVLVQNTTPVVFDGIVREVLGSFIPQQSPIPVFPLLPYTFPIKVTPMMMTVIGASTSDREVRIPMQQLPLWQIELPFDELRDQTQNTTPGPMVGFTQYMQLVELWLSMYGQAGVFAFDAPWDNSREDQIIGLGDGHQYIFTIVRTWGQDPAFVTEPIGMINEVFDVSINGATVDPSTYYVERNKIFFISDGFVHPPVADATITMTFSFYYACRFTDNNQDFEEFSSGRWTVGGLKFQSVYWP